MNGAAVLILLALAGPWPDLPSTGFLAGRAATGADVRTGVAAFAQGGGDKPPEVLDVVIPQYACFTDDSGAKVRAILIQAENSPMGPIVGLRLAPDVTTLNLLSEVTLLGPERPADKECQ